MSIASKLTDLETVRAALVTSVNAQGGALAAGATLWNIKSAVDAITTGGGSSDYYRCASVDTTAQTWTGYKAVLTDGVYSFESTVTTGLTYTSVVPVVNSIYTADALVKIGSLWTGIPTDGLMFYAPLDQSHTMAGTGQTLNVVGAVSYTTENNVPCAVFAGNAGIYAALNGQYASASISLWAKSDATGGVAYPVVAMLGTSSYNQSSNTNTVMLYDTTANLCAGDVVTNLQTENPLPSLSHIVYTYQNNERKLYVNGTLIASDTASSGTVIADYVAIGCTSYGLNGSQGYNGKIARVRVYNRALSADEVQKLYNEI
ncbi:MAG: LamG domain-containing protein [Victivallaceae bacterium]|nr:LamG domain-containing protein [Victivallaceae bacterium]